MDSETKNRFGGFEYRRTDPLNEGAWQFRPVGSFLYVLGPGTRGALLGLLADPVLALRFYEAEVAWRSDTVGAEEEVARIAEQSGPAGAVGGHLAGRQNRARNRLAETRQVRQLLVDCPFDVEAWKGEWLPSSTQGNS